MPEAPEPAPDPSSEPPGGHDGASDVHRSRRLRDAADALRYRNFRLFWSGAIVSNTGQWMQRVTVPFVLFQLTGSTTWIGIATFMQFIPVVVMGPIGGSIADRFPRRSVLLVTQSVMALLALALWATWVGGVANRFVLIGLVFLMGTNFGINGPAWQSFVSELVPRPVLLNAVTLNSTQFNGARALGPALAGIVIATGGPGWVFLLNGLSFAAVLAALALIDIRRPRRTDAGPARPFREFGDALRHAARFPGILAAFVLVAALGFLGGPVVQLLPAFAEDVFGVGDVAYGLLGAALGAGAVLGAPLVAGRGSGMARSRLVVVADRRLQRVAGRLRAGTRLRRRPGRAPRGRRRLPGDRLDAQHDDPAPGRRRPPGEGAGRLPHVPDPGDAPRCARAGLARRRRGPPPDGGGGGVPLRRRHRGRGPGDRVDPTHGRRGRRRRDGAGRLTRARFSRGPRRRGRGGPAPRSQSSTRRHQRQRAPGRFTGSAASCPERDQPVGRRHGARAPRRRARPR
ncbi:MAG: MFS transporter [Acidimicrobiia bacterium]|nr:MFS transporter [Acidimicrobiia bacterium]